MKIEKIIQQHRRDFVAIMKCEFCGYRDTNTSGYDDRYYHDHVIPAIKCGKCGESTLSKGGTIDRTPTRYPEGFQI